MPRRVVRVLRKRSAQPEKLALEKVIGSTATTASAIACNATNGDLAYTAGGVIVIYRPRTNAQVRFLHSKAVKSFQCVCYSRNGKFIAAAESGHLPKIVVWDAETGLVLSELQGHKFGHACLQFSPNTKFLVSVGHKNDGALRVWDWRNNEPVASCKVSSRVNHVAFSSDSKYMVTAGVRHLKFWSLDELAAAGETPQSALGKSPEALDGRSASLGAYFDHTFTGVAVGEDGVYAVSRSGVLCFINQNRVLEKWVDLKSSGAFHLSISNTYIACACTDSVVRIFRPGTLQYVATLPKQAPLGDYAVGDSMLEHKKTSVFPDTMSVCLDVPEQMTCLYSDRSIVVWDIRAIKNVGKLRALFSHGACIWDLEVLNADQVKNQPDLEEGMIVTCSSDNTVRFWNPHAHRDVERIRRPPTTPAGVSRANRDLWRVIHIDRQNMGALKAPSDTKAESRDGGVRALAVSKHGDQLAVGDRSGNLYFYSMNDMRLQTEEVAHEAEVLSLAYGEISGRTLLASASRDRLIHLFDVSNSCRSHAALPPLPPPPTGHARPFEAIQFVGTLDDHTSSVTCVRFSHAGDRLLSCSADKTVIFRNVLPDTESEAKVSTPRYFRAVVPYGTIYHLDVMQSDKFAVTAGQDKKINIWNLATGRAARQYRHDTNAGEPLKLQVDPSGLFFVTSGTDKQIRLFDFLSGQQIAAVSGHAEVVTGIRFAPDCQRVITVSGDGCIFVWKLESDITLAILQRLGEMSARSPVKRTPSVSMHSILSDQSAASAATVVQQQQQQQQQPASAGSAAGARAASPTRPATAPAATSASPRAQQVQQQVHAQAQPSQPRQSTPPPSSESAARESSPTRPQTAFVPGPRAAAAAAAAGAGAGRRGAVPPPNALPAWATARVDTHTSPTAAAAPAEQHQQQQHPEKSGSAASPSSSGASPSSRQLFSEEQTPRSRWAERVGKADLVLYSDVDERGVPVSPSGRGRLTIQAMEASVDAATAAAQASSTPSAPQSTTGAEAQASHESDADSGGETEEVAHSGDEAEETPDYSQLIRAPESDGVEFHVDASSVHDLPSFQSPFSPIRRSGSRPATAAAATAAARTGTGDDDDDDVRGASALGTGDERDLFESHYSTLDVPGASNALQPPADQSLRMSISTRFIQARSSRNSALGAHETSDADIVNFDMSHVADDDAGTGTGLPDLSRTDDLFAGAAAAVAAAAHLSAATAAASTATATSTATVASAAVSSPVRPTSAVAVAGSPASPPAPVADATPLRPAAADAHDNDSLYDDDSVTVDPSMSPPVRAATPSEPAEVSALGAVALGVPGAGDTLRLSQTGTERLGVTGEHMTQTGLSAVSDLSLSASMSESDFAAIAQRSLRAEREVARMKHRKEELSHEIERTRQRLAALGVSPSPARSARTSVSVSSSSASGVAAAIRAVRSSGEAASAAAAANAVAATIGPAVAAEAHESAAALVASVIDEQVDRTAEASALDEEAPASAQDGAPADGADTVADGATPPTRPSTAGSALSHTNASGASFADASRSSIDSVASLRSATLPRASMASSVRVSSARLRQLDASDVQRMRLQRMQASADGPLSDDNAALACDAFIAEVQASFSKAIDNVRALAHSAMLDRLPLNQSQAVALRLHQTVASAREQLASLTSELAQSSVFASLPELHVDAHEPADVAASTASVAAPAASQSPRASASSVPAATSVALDEGMLERALQSSQLVSRLEAAISARLERSIAQRLESLIESKFSLALRATRDLADSRAALDADD